MAAKSPSRGYLVEFVEKPPEDAETDCPICFHVIFKPKLALCCHHSFCSDCISNTEHEGKPCPLCNEQIQLIDDKRLERTLNGYTVYCPHKEKGCEWTGELGQLEKHLNRQEATTATAAGGGGGGEDLMKGCQYQVIQCGLCQSHQCERRLMPDHVSKECHVQCDYIYAGCNFKGPQDQLSTHNKDAVNIHLSLVTNLMKTGLAEKEDKIGELAGELKQANTDSRENLRRVRGDLNEEKQSLKDYKRQMGRELDSVKKSMKIYRKGMIGVAIGGIVLTLLLASVGGWYSTSLRMEMERKLASATSQQQHTHPLDLKQHNECYRNDVEGIQGNISLICSSCCPLSKLELIEAELDTLREQIDYPSFPVHLTLTNFTKLRETTGRWLSVPFYACTLKQGYGYLVRLVVYPNGTGSGNGTHVSVYLHLMKGKHDRNLTWPFQDVVKVVLNVPNDNQQVSKTFNFSDAAEIGGRVPDGIMAVEGLGYYRFISHSMIAGEEEVTFEIRYANPDKTCGPYQPQGEELSGAVVFIVIMIICCCMFAKSK